MSSGERHEHVAGWTVTPVEEWFVGVVGTDPLVQGLAGGVVIAALNLLGASVVLVWRSPSERALDAALGFAAGVMLSASFTSLLLPGIAFASEPGYDPVVIGGVAFTGLVPVLIGAFLGVALLDRGETWVHYAGPIVGNRLLTVDNDVADTNPPKDDVHRRRIDPRRVVDHLRVDDAGTAESTARDPDTTASEGGATTGEAESAASETEPTTDDAGSTVGDGGPTATDDQARPLAGVVDPRITAVVLFTVAITLHNMPEGLAVGVGFGSGDVGEGVALMIAIGLQNVPEGLAVSVAAINAGLGRRWYAAVAGIRAGVVEIPLAVAGAAAVTVAAPLLPYAMGFAAGGMLYVIGDEIIPETHSRGYERVATHGLLLGAAVMLTLDVTLA